ncbi:uncharacterized protein LOC124462547 [Hypomesus transpacificus]|uniref:uncharacterized protein LOC124462547 n=1 Tax=Hypomesus transpacificus TaxID=137520 RepID=UPI001F075EA0|nr:uncharacterized protein LOC124462547 [Hypomesus transpacificus]
MTLLCMQACVVKVNRILLTTIQTSVPLLAPLVVCCAREACLWLIYLDMMNGIERRLFEGNGKKGKSPIYSISDLENGFYRTAGEVFSVSLAQSDPAPCFFRNWCFQFLATGDFDTLQLTKDDVDDQEYSSLLERQIRKGMKFYNLVELIGRHPDLCSNLFVPKDDDDRADADYIMSIIVPELGERGSPRHAKENAIVNFFQDFLQELEITGQDEDQAEPLTEEVKDPQSQNEECLEPHINLSLSVPSVLQWLTGQRHKPLLPSERASFKINVKFEHHCKELQPDHRICYPLVSACTNTITFPVAHMNTYSEFRDIMTVAIRMSRGFGRV